MQVIWQALIGTPWWVYLIFVYLIWIGIKAMSPRVRPLKKLFILPVLFGALSVHTLSSSFIITTPILALWGVASVLGLMVGAWYVSLLNLQVDRTHRLLKMSGTFSTLVILLIVFCSKYYFGYAIAVDPARLHNTHFEYALLATTSLTCSFFVGRLIGYLYYYLRAPSVDLTGT